MEFPLFLTILIIFLLVIISYSIKDLDFVAISLLGCFLAATITAIIKNLSFEVFISFVEIFNYSCNCSG